MPNLSEIFYYNGEVSLWLIVVPLFIGVTLAIIASFFIRLTLGGFIRKLLAESTSDPNSAKTIAELGFEKNFMIKAAIKSHAFRKLVHAITVENLLYIDKNYYDINEKTPIDFGESKPKLDINTAKFYIPDEKRYQATATFDQNGTTFKSALLSIVAIIIAGVFAMWVVPELIIMFQNFIETI